MQNRTSGSGLKALREQAGLTQQELSRQTGVSRSLISQWENGVISVSPATRKRIAAFFGVDADTLDSGARQPDAAQQPAQPAVVSLVAVHGRIVQTLAIDRNISEHAASTFRRGAPQLFLIKVVPHLGQVIEIRPRPRGTRSCWRQWGQRKYR